MCAYLIEYDLNSWSNKRLRTPGRLYEDLFRFTWVSIMNEDKKIGLKWGM